jgi:hypothetical protein
VHPGEEDRDGQWIDFILCGDAGAVVCARGFRVLSVQDQGDEGQRRDATVPLAVDGVDAAIGVPEASAVLQSRLQASGGLADVADLRDRDGHLARPGQPNANSRRCARARCEYRRRGDRGDESDEQCFPWDVHA